MLSVIIPIFNEVYLAENIIRLRNVLPKDHEIIVVDDGSFFPSPVTSSWGQENPLHFIRKRINEGKGAAIKTGLLYASGEHILIIDGDLQINPVDVYVFLARMSLYNADAVIGNKRHLYSIVDYSFGRWVISNTYNFLCRCLFNIQLRDTQTGLKLFKKQALDKIMNLSRFGGSLYLLHAGIRYAVGNVVSDCG